MALTYKPLANPILILSDAPEQLTGLARIGRDLADLLCTMPEFRVAYLGMGGMGRRKFPWTSYSFPEGQWGLDHIAQAWKDFAGYDTGVILSTWDASRMLWFGQAQTNGYEPLARFLGEGRSFSKWGYFPVDGTGPDLVSLPTEMRAAVAGYNRVCAASEWGANVLRAGGRGDADWLTHGIWMDRFKPREDEPIAWDSEDIVVGCVMANQARKDFPIAFETARLLRAEYGNQFKFWLHTDTLIRYWNVHALAVDYGISDCLEVSTDCTDAELAVRYSACDCTILPSGGEGFGYPIAESLACGTACIVTNYAAGQELVEDSCKVEPVTYKVDTMHNIRRAVLSAYGFAAKAKGQIEAKRQDWDYRSQQLRSTVEHLDWHNLSGLWKKYFRDGLK